MSQPPEPRFLRTTVRLIAKANPTPESFISYLGRSFTWRSSTTGYNTGRGARRARYRPWRCGGLLDKNHPACVETSWPPSLVWPPRSSTSGWLADEIDYVLNDSGAKLMTIVGAEFKDGIDRIRDRPPTRGFDRGGSRWGRATSTKTLAAATPRAAARMSALTMFASSCTPPAPPENPKGVRPPRQT